MSQESNAIGLSIMNCDRVGQREQNKKIIIVLPTHPGMGDKKNRARTHNSVVFQKNPNNIPFISQLDIDIRIFFSCKIENFFLYLCCRRLDGYHAYRVSQNSSDISLK